MITDRSDPSQDFVEQFLAHQSRIYAFIVSLLPNRADADDVLQETGLTLFQKYPMFQPGTDFLAWACRVAQNKVMDFGKRRGRDRLRFGSETLELVAEEYIGRGEGIAARLRALDGCMAKLPPKDRELLQHCYRSQQTAKTVAQTMNRSADAVYKALRRIRTALYDCIQRTLAREQHP